jgi:hypothetical protein
VSHPVLEHRVVSYPEVSYVIPIRVRPVYRADAVALSFWRTSALSGETFTLTGDQGTSLREATAQA